MAIARKIAYNVIFNSVAKVISTTLALISIGFITRYLGKDGFGDYSTVLAFFSFFGAVADLGLYSIATREISRSGADEEKILGNVLSLRIFTSVAVLLLSPILIYFLPYEANVKIGILLIAASFVFSSTYLVLNGVFQKNLAMDKVMTAEVFGKIIQLLIIIAAVKYDLGFDVVISSILASMAFNFIAVFFLARKYVRISLRIDPAYWRSFLKYSFPMGVSVFVTFLYFKMDTILLSILKTNTEVGIYNAAYKVLENVTFFPAMIIGLVLPILSRHIFTDRREFERIADETAKVFLVLIVPALIGTLFLADDIIRLIGGAGFEQSANTLRVLIVALAFIFFGNFFNNILIAGNLQKKLMFVLVACAALNISANLIMIPLYSYQGAAYVSVLTEACVALSTGYLVYRNLNYAPKFTHLPGILFSGAAMSSFLLFFSDHNFFLLAAASSCVYAIFLWLTKTVSISELKSITAPDRRSLDMQEI